MTQFYVIFFIFFLFISKISAVFQCKSYETTVFVRIPTARLDAQPGVTSVAGHDYTCSQYCRHNMELTTGAERLCASFNFDGKETCYFFNDAAAPEGEAKLNLNSSINNFYYEKTCLPGVNLTQACIYRAFTFERLKKTFLEGFVKKSMQTSTREECLSACLKEEEFVCRSINYHGDTYLCELSSEDRRSKPIKMRLTDENVDYYDNNCLNRQNRCGELGGNIVFVKTPNFEIEYHDHTVSQEAHVENCLQKCLDSFNTFCRSVEYQYNEKNCIVSDEDTILRSNQQKYVENKDYFEPICVSADLSSSVCRQQSAFTRIIGHAIEGQPIAAAQKIMIAECISLCFQNFHCKSINYDRTQANCYIYGVGQNDANLKDNSSFDYYEFECEMPFAGQASCTNQGIRFIVNSKNPYTGAIYAAERFSTCSQIVNETNQFEIFLPLPTVSPNNCGTRIKDGKLEGLVVISFDGVEPYQVTTEWDRFYQVFCDISVDRMVREGSVIATTLFETSEANMQVLDMGTPPPITATLTFLDNQDKPLNTTSIGEDIQLIISSEQAGPHNMRVENCTATRIGGKGETPSFKIIESGCPRYPDLIGRVIQDFEKNRLVSKVKAFRLDGSYDIQIECTVMFCAGKNGCEVRTCAQNSDTNIQFMSAGKRKRRSIYESVVATENEKQTEETLSAIIRVLAEGEQDEEANFFYKNNLSFPLHKRPLTKVESKEINNLVCITDSWFVSTIVSMSVLCLMLSALIVVWGCNVLRVNSKQ